MDNCARCQTTVSFATIARAMSSTIYRKYRPQFFAEVVGQDHVIKTLQNEIIQSKLAHAYLFCGMRGVGKTTVARLLAKAINCSKRTDKQSEPCDQCESCLAITSGRSLDLIEIDAASNRRIDDVREIREHIPYGPSQARFKVVIIDEVHMLTTEAFNALLKTLEEPPAHVVFILCTTEVNKLPETIISRCQRFDFGRISSSVLLARLAAITKSEKVKVQEDVLKRVVELAGGSSRDAESYLGKILSLGKDKISTNDVELILPKSDLAVSLSFINYLIKGQASEAVEHLNNFLAQGGDLSYFYHQVLDLMRKMLLVKLGGRLASEASLDLSTEHSARLTELSGLVTNMKLYNMLMRWLKIENSWRSADIWQLPLELAAVEIATNGQEISVNQEINNHPAKITPVEAVSNYEGDNTSVLEFSQIISHWPEVVADLREYNHSLSFILSVAKPIKLEGKTLTIGFSYDLHLERVKEPKVIAVIEQSLAKIFGHKIKVSPITHTNQSGQADLLSNVLNAFGGNIVE